MHDHTADLTQYEWPTCAACHKPLWENEYERQVCRPCEDKTRVRLQELPGLFTKLNTTAALMRGASGGGAPSSGTKTPPIPPRLEVLTLVAAGGAATRLRDIEDAWRKQLGWTVAPWRGSPRQAVPELVTFLLNNLPWAADAYDSVAQDVEDIRRLHAECTAAVANERKPGRVKTGLCPVRADGNLCRAQLTAVATNHRIRCGQCGTEWADLGAWRTLRQQQDAVLAELAGVAA
ncbi:hypothetical protein ABZ438_08065 [Streptomyces sp. NPDC005786]|uniref:hypothetical protein n=1 Tax=Streptomyces sp. NPDC005786 TaxID=3154891 RepID=UPI0033E93372